MVQDINRRKFLEGTAVAGVTITIAGCLGDDEPEPTDDDDDDDIDDDDDTEPEVREIRYGILMPETGDLGPLGGPIRDGALLPSRQLDGEIDFEFDISTADTQTDPQAGISEADALVDAGYPAVVGPAASNVNLQVTRQSFIPNRGVGISPSSTAPAVTHLEDDGYIFRTAPSDALQGPVIAQVAVDQFDASTMGTMFLNDDYGQALEESLVEAFETDHNGQVSNRVSFEPEQPSYSSQLGEALGDDPDVLFIVGFPQSGIQIFRDYYDEFHDEYDIPIIVPDGLIDSALPGEVGNPMNNVWGTAPAAAGPSADLFAQLYEDEFDRAPGVFNSHAYDAAAVVILANAAAGENDGTAIRDQMREVANPPGEEITAENLAEGVAMAANGEEIQFSGASSAVDFDDNGDMMTVAYDVLRYQDGEIEQQERIEFEN